jgi:hypothetical protein
MLDKNNKNELIAKNKSLLESFNTKIDKALADNPTRLRLVKALFARMVAGTEAFLVNDSPNQAEFIENAEAVKEISSWVFPETVPDIDAIAQSWRQAGMNLVQAVEVAKASIKRGRGRPVSKKLIAVEAYDLKYNSKIKTTWAKIADKLCDCGMQERHRIYTPCCQSLRQNVNNLKRILKNYKV